MMLFKKALIVSAFFCGSAFFIPLSLANCPPDHINETATVLRIYDGDTVKLKDGRKIRLTGIDTPELGRNNRPTQAYASKAKNALIKLLKQSDNKIGLSFGVERHDKYKRTLAHLYLPDGSSIQAFLLRNGFATAFTTPPNDHFTDCYQTAELKARNSHRGIWSLNKYKVKRINQLTSSDKGFRRVEGKVTSISQSKKAFWITLQGNLKIRIANKDLLYFDKHSLNQLKNKNIRIRGWLHPRKKGYFMALRHPSALLTNIRP
jgi:micrococcal nuclease